MTYTIHASKNDQSTVTVRINPATAVDKARVLELLGWQVHVPTHPDICLLRWTSIGFHRLLARPHS
jgi:hypothetical protein